VGVCMPAQRPVGEDGPGESRVTTRCCGNCRHFQRINGSTTGHCTNPPVVSHQGGLVMYREAEVGCRRGWKEDLFEPLLPDDRVAANAPRNVPADAEDRDRAVAWANTLPDRLTGLQAPNQEQASNVLENELLDPKRTRNAKEAIRRARESRQRELHTAASRDPLDQPILPPLTDDTLIDERPLPPVQRSAPIVPPVSAEEVRARAIEARRVSRGYESPLNLSLREDDERFAAIPTNEPAQTDPEEINFTPATPEDSLIAQSASDDYLVESALPIVPMSDAESLAAFNAIVGAEELADEPEWSAGPDSAPELIQTDVEEEWEDEPVQFEATASTWPEQAPWVEESEAVEPWEPKRPKRRSLLDSLFHRNQERRIEPTYIEEPWAEDEADAFVEPIAAASAWNELPGVAEEVVVLDYEDVAYENVAPRTAPSPQPQYALPPLPYDVEEEGEDLLLMDADLNALEDDEQIATPLPHICATCRYFRPYENGGTCGNPFAFSFTRVVDENSLSCASSIGAWWLPSDSYWESLGDVSHHGQPTPLLDRLVSPLSNRDENEELGRTTE
jgi:hypothetical protein